MYNKSLRSKEKYTIKHEINKLTELVMASFVSSAVEYLSRKIHNNNLTVLSNSPQAD